MSEQNKSWNLKNLKTTREKMLDKIGEAKDIPEHMKVTLLEMVNAFDAKADILWLDAYNHVIEKTGGGTMNVLHISLTSI